ncbi:hypothetical protein V6N13_018961 [Hibiscus sabdariffa]|uniref:Uncharacterized protein n=1 Tax=Hibiscus sabdariffa TaxID=183260 RepID=A0ABR2EM10_9ROSI
MLNDRKTPPYSMSPTGIDLTEENRFVDSRPLHMKEGKPGFFGTRFPDRKLESGRSTASAIGSGGKRGHWSGPTKIMKISALG